jgi:hypothetical protein
MALGPGKYDDLCTHVREKAKAQAAIVIVLNGERGSGFSMQAGLNETLGLPELLESIAAQIRGDLAKGKL